MKTAPKIGRSLQHEYLEVFRDKLIPLVAANTAKVVLGHPSRAGASQGGTLPSGIAVSSEKGPLLDEPRHKGFYVRSAAWPEAGFHSTRFTMLLCVLEGETDFRIGVTQRMVEEHGLDRECGFQIWRLPANSICVIPSDVPFDDGNRPHWCRPDLENARSHLHWIHLIPAGALIHSCRTCGERHEMSPYLCVRDPALTSLGDLLCQALSRRSLRSAEISHANLLALLWAVEQEIATVRSTGLELGHGLKTEGADSLSVENAAVRRAQQYILAHLHEPLNVEAVAAAAYGSPSWLNRLFQAELNMSIMQYVTHVRIKEARMLLTDTDLSVTEIGELVGFADPSYFSQVFTRWEKVSPNQFRKKLG